MRASRGQGDGACAGPERRVVVAHLGNGAPMCGLLYRRSGVLGLSVISSGMSRTLVIPTNEELAIAHATMDQGAG